MKSFSLTYASSLFSLAEDEKKTEVIMQELEAIAELLKENSDYVKLLDSPTIKLEERLELIDAAFSSFCEYVVNFIKLLCEKKCAHLFLSCVKEYEKLYNKKHNVEKVTVITAVPLSDELKEKLLKKLEMKLEKKVRPEYSVDKTLVGGIILRTENSQTDASVRARLESLHTQITALS